jgi:hypothetical protein
MASSCWLCNGSVDLSPTLHCNIPCAFSPYIHLHFNLHIWDVCIGFDLLLAPFLSFCSYSNLEVISVLSWYLLWILSILIWWSLCSCFCQWAGLVQSGLHQIGDSIYSMWSENLDPLLGVYWILFTESCHSFLTLILVVSNTSIFDNYLAKVPFVLCVVL